MEVSIFAAFVAGIISFIAPCVLPLVPAYIFYISGVSVEELKSSEKTKGQTRKVILSSMSFILGFSLVFIILGATATALGQFLLDKINVIMRIAGIVIVIFGLHMVGLFRIKFLYYEKKIHVRSKAITIGGAFLVGMAFAFGWTPCIGPILASILSLAATKDTIWKGILLLSIYSLGLAIPFLLTAIATNKFFKVFEKIKKHFRAIEIVAGIFLIIMGIMISLNYLTVLSALFSKWFPFLNNIG